MFRAFRFVAVFGAAVAACGGPQASNPSPSASEAAAQGNFLKADGTIDYALLHQTFGEPNENLTLNPRATDVAQTPSVNSVTNLPNSLVFAASGAAWLLGKQPGDTLYCNHVCGGSGFLRNIVSMQAQGSQIVVQTVNGKLTDVVWNGWLHGVSSFGSIPAQAAQQGGSQPGVSPAPNGTVTPAPRDEGKTSPKGGEPGKHSFEETISGSVNVTPDFEGSVVMDMVVQLWSWSGPSVQLIEFDCTATPSVEMEAEVEAEVAYSPPSWTFWPEIKIPLAVVPVGPVEITPELDLTLTGKIQVSGAITLTANAKASETLEFGFIYTQAAGAKLIDKATNNNTSSMTIKGEAGLSALAEFEAALPFKIYDIAGPQLVADLDLGAEVTESATTTTFSDGGTACGNELEGDFFLDLTGKVGVTLDVKIFEYSANFQLVEQKWTFPTKKWTYDIPDSFSLCSSEDGGTADAGSPSDGGTKDGGTASDGGSTDGGSPDAGNVGCSSTADCTAQFGSGWICIIPANICGLTSGTNYCSNNPSDTVGLSCSSSSDCGTGYNCASCSAFSCSTCSPAYTCSGNCCQ
jgi:hypothetical protein